MQVHLTLNCLERGIEVQSIVRFLEKEGLPLLSEDFNDMVEVSETQWQAIDHCQMEDDTLPRFAYPDAWDRQTT